MEYQIAIYSGDAVFARMIELEFMFFGKSVLRAPQAPQGAFAQVAIWDLDSAHAPDSDSYHRMIGFTKGSALLADDASRQCSLILHRPFEMQLLRREVLEGEEMMAPVPSVLQIPPQRKILLDPSEMLLSVDGIGIHISPREAQVIGLLLSHRGEAVSREQISREIGESTANKADVYVCYLRRKLDFALGGIKLISTVRGKGYCIE